MNQDPTLKRSDVTNGAETRAIYIALQSLLIGNQHPDLSCRTNSYGSGPPPWWWPRAFGGGGAAGVGTVLLLWRRDTWYLASRNLAWGEFICPGERNIEDVTARLHQSFKCLVSFLLSLCSFQDKMYILSSEEAYKKFTTNPRPYLLPPMPRFPCRICIVGPPQAGTTTLCRLLAQSYNARVLDVDELLKPFLSKEEQERIEKIKTEATFWAIDIVTRNIEEETAQTSGKFCFLNNTFCIVLPQYSLFWDLTKFQTFLSLLQKTQMRTQILKKVRFQTKWLIHVVDLHIYFSYCIFSKFSCIFYQEKSVYLKVRHTA